MERYSPPSGETKPRPSRPRPLVCFAAKSVNPSGTPLAARPFKSVLVLVTHSLYTACACAPPAATLLLRPSSGRGVPVMSVHTPPASVTMSDPAA